MAVNYVDTDSYIRVSFRGHSDADTTFITSAKEVMFLPSSVRLAAG